MPVELIAQQSPCSRPVHIVSAGKGSLAGLDEQARRWANLNGFEGAAGKVLIFPDSSGEVGGALLGTGEIAGPEAALLAGALARDLPAGDWHLAHPHSSPDLFSLALKLGAYRFTRYGGKAGRELRFVLPQGADAGRTEQIAEGVCFARDLINTPACDMGPEAVEAVLRDLGGRHGASVSAITGEKLIERGFPMIHAVGRAAAEAPRLLDLQWGCESAPRLTLVGKGVCFDTGGLDIKPSSAMLLMKKDMGGAASVLGLASMIMAARLEVRLRVLIPAVENAISASAFRPGDILRSRKGITVEVGNTDAEGRLVLADALALADEEEPELLIDMATLTGAARVALGPDIAPFFTHDDILADDIAAASKAVADAAWRLPLWKHYAEGLSSKVADMGNVTTNGFAGAITAALFLSRFVERTRQWAHFDIYGWNPATKTHVPQGGEAQGIRALFQVLEARFGK